MPVARVHPSVSAFSRGRRRLASRTRIDTVLELRDIRHRRMANAVDGGETGDAAVAVEPQDGLEGADAELARQALDVLDRELARPCHEAVTAPLPASVELGLRVHRDRVRARSTRTRAEQELLSLFAGQWRNGLLPHIVFTDGAHYFPGPEFWQTDARRMHRSSRARRESSSRRSTRPRRCTCTGSAPDRERARGVPVRDAAEARGLARLPLPRADRAATALVEVWHPVGDRAWTTPRSGTSRSPASSSARAKSPSYRRVDAELADAVGAADERRVRPLRVPRARLPRATTTTRRRSARRRRSSCRPCSSTRCSSSRTAIWPRSPRAAGDDPAPHEARAEATAADDERAALGRRRGAVRRPRRACRRARITTPTAGSASRRCMPASRAAERAERLIAASRRCRRRARRAGLGRREPAAGRPSLRADALLARPGLADHELGPVPRPASATATSTSPPRAGSPRRAAAALRLLGALQPRERQRSWRRAFSWTAALILDAPRRQILNAPAGSRAGRERRS